MRELCVAVLATGQGNRILRRRVLSHLMSEGVTILDPETTYIDPFVQVGQDTVIYPQVLLVRVITCLQPRRRQHW